MGFATSPEVAREILTKAGGMALRVENPLGFAAVMAKAHLVEYARAERLDEPMLYDRGLPDVAGFLMVSGIAVPDHIDHLCRTVRYSGPIFRAPAWKAIYRQDEQRIQSWEEAVASDEAVSAAWRYYGYDLVALPFAPIAERIAFLRASSIKSVTSSGICLKRHYRKPMDILNLLAVAAAAAPGMGSFAEIWQHIVNDFSNITSPSAMSAFLQILMIDIVLAGDNAIVVGALAAGLPADQRRKVIMIGILAALVLRIIFALGISFLLQQGGWLILAGGLLLLFVAWRMYRDIRADHSTDSEGSPEIVGDEDSGIKPAKTFAAAAWGVAVADVSMSLDNVLAVAGAAREHPGILIVGLILSVILMGIAANFIARYIERYRWIAWVGLAVILYVAVKMIIEGWTAMQGVPATAWLSGVAPALV